MVAVYKTYNDYLQDLNTASPRQYDLQGGGGGGVSQEGAETAVNVPSERSISTATTGNGSSPAAYQSGGLTDIYSRLFQPLKQGAETQTGELSNIYSQFRQGAGPSRSFEGIGGQGTLEDVIQGKQQISAAKPILGAEYKGPTGLDPTGYGRLQESVGELRQRGQALSGLPGIMDLLSSTTPGLTPGELRMEAQRLQSSPEFQTQARETQSGIENIYRSLYGKGTEAQAFAKQRGTEEKGIAEAGRGFLEGRRGDILGDIDTKIAAEKAEQMAAESAYRKLAETGSLADLAGVPKEALTVDPQAFNTQTRQASQASNQAYQQIMEKYPELLDVPQMSLGITSHGRQTLRFPDEWFTQNEGKYSKDEMAKIKQMARIRQKEFEDAGFGAGGEQATFNPVNLGTELGRYESPDVRQYLAFDPGISPSRGNLSTEEQRGQVNRINEALEEVERLQASDEPYRAATLAADLDQYLADEEASMKERGGKLNQQLSEWLQFVKKARKRYRKSHTKIAKLVKSATGSDKFAQAMAQIGNASLRGDVGGAMSGGMALSGAGMSVGANPQNR